MDDITNCLNLLENGNIDSLKEKLKEMKSTLYLDVVDWEVINDAAEKSNWIPEQYYRNDWVSDVVKFLVGDDTIHKTD